ncbi:MAG: hypothetical protein ACUVRM_11575 [Bacillota bacterium]
MLPLGGIWLAAPLLGHDRDLGLAELQAVRPWGLGYQIVFRYMLVIVYLLLVAFFLAWAAGGRGRDLSFLLGLIISVLPSLLFFSLFAMMGSLAAGSVAAGFTVAVVLWGGFITYSLLSPSTGLGGWITPFPGLLGIRGVQALVNRLLYLAAWVAMGLVCPTLIRSRYAIPNRE